MLVCLEQSVYLTGHLAEFYNTQIDEMPLNVAYVENYLEFIRAYADGFIQRPDLDDLYSTLCPAITHDHPHDETDTDPGGSPSLAIDIQSASRLHTTLYICHDGIPSRFFIYSLLWPLFPCPFSFLVSLVSTVPLPKV